MHESDPQSPQGIRLIEGMRQLTNGEGDERPEWTRFTDERLAEAVGQANEGALQDRPTYQIVGEFATETSNAESVDYMQESKNLGLDPK